MLLRWVGPGVNIITWDKDMLFFQDETVKDFMIHVVKHCLGIIDSWIAKQYGLEKCVICPGCHRKVAVTRENMVNSNKV